MVRNDLDLMFYYNYNGHRMLYLPWFGLWFMVFNDTFNNISVISLRSVLLVGETGVPGEKPPSCCKSLTNFIA